MSSCYHPLQAERRPSDLAILVAKWSKKAVVLLCISNIQGLDSGLPRLEPTRVRYERHRYADMGRYPNFRGQFGEAKGLLQHVTTV